MVFQWNLSNSESPQVSRTLLSILAVLNNAVVSMISTRPPTSKSSSLFNNPLVTVPKVPITIDIIATFMFHSFFNSLANSRYLSFFSNSFSFILWSARTAKFTILQILFLFSFFFFFFLWLIIIRSGLLAEIRWSVSMSKSHRGLCVSFLVDHLAHPVVSCLILLQWNLLHSVIMWLIIIINIIIIIIIVTRFEFRSIMFINETC